MATSFEIFYDIFLEKIDDKTLAKLANEDLSQMLDNYILNSVSIHFKQCKKDLSKYARTLYTEDEENSTPIIYGYFYDDLTREEIYIVVLGMIIEWISPKIYKERLLKQSFSDRDYKQGSSWQTLGKLQELKAQSESDLRKTIQSYQYIGCDFSGI